MKLSAYISPVLYRQYCRINWIEDSDDSVRRFLREIGTHSVTFQDVSGGEYRTVPEGTCVRLHSTEKYGMLSTRFLNLYATMYSRPETPQVEVRLPSPSVAVASSFNSWRCLGSQLLRISR